MGGILAAPRGGAAGVLIAMLANFLFTSSDAIVKSLTSSYSVFQIIIMQVAFACIPLAVMLARDGTLTRLHVRHPRLVLARGVLAGLGTIFAFTAFSRLPLAEAYAIQFCIPIAVTVASVPLLGERVGWRRGLAVAVGFLGILVMVRPGFEALSLGHLAAFCTVFTGSGVILIMRRIGREEERGVMVAAVMLGLLAASLPGLAVAGRVPEWGDLGLAGLAGLVMGTAQFLALEALKRAPAASIAPMQYTMLVWAILYGLLVFGDPVRLHVVAGAVIVIASSLYILHRERVRTGERVQAVPARPPHQLV